MLLIIIMLGKTNIINQYDITKAFQLIFRRKALFFTKKRTA